MSLRVFDKCALQYLKRWIDTDSGYCDALNNGTDGRRLAGLNKAVTEYGIARNLPRRGDVEKGLPRYKPLLEVIDSVTQVDFTVDTVSKILKVESAISEKYGGKRVLSATTKVLWLKVKSPIIIYDNRARIAVGTRKGDLADFYASWTAAFTKHSDRIAAACAKLATATKCTANEKLATKEYIKDLTSHRWFWERVFDIYLWKKGGG